MYSVSSPNVSCVFVYMVYRNGQNVEGSTHKQVVDLIKSGGDVLKLVVLSVTSQVKERRKKKGAFIGE